MTAVAILLAVLGLAVLRPVGLWFFGICYKLYAKKSPLLYVAAGPMVLMDVTFQVTWGTYYFRERPREFFFSDRVRRHLHSDPPGSDWRDEALHWKSELNARWPGHIRDIEYDGGT